MGGFIDFLLSDAVLSFLLIAGIIGFGLYALYIMILEIING